MHPTPPRIELSVGFANSRTSRIVSVCVLSAMLVVACCCLGGILGAFGAGVSDGSTDDQPVVMLLSAGLLTVLAATGSGLLIAFTVRTGAWLDGTWLTVRNLRARSIDLRTAHTVTLRAVAQAQTGVSSDGAIISTGAVTRTPVITVSGPGTTVHLRLRSRDGILIPPAEMLALATALSTAPAPGAHEAAAWLRAMAAQPGTMLL